ncbi:regulator of chromosome condensation RCC1 repeat protein [Nitzschia inconspicua]|uniref:Regulator of chromosome condensation RCC1 repeat protein n=1 Tax=Nitzschia inconspicua TaxID=303405 RepID=A0A9K3PQY9_9STRA|nr:regulator of chromosome condensation RCC1 repeat protein [Nitzschia inconspicua]
MALISRPNGNNKNNGPPVRAGSAPPARGYEKPMPHPASRDVEKSHHHTSIHPRGLPPKNPSRSTNSNPATVQPKRRRVPQSISASSSSTSSSSCTESTEMRCSLASRCSLALSRTESIMVSAAGDVIVCRCRRSSTPYIPTQTRDLVDPYNKQHVPCCDPEILSTIDAPWSPVFHSLTSPKHKTISSSSRTTTSEFSTYTWEASNSKKSLPNEYILAKGNDTPCAKDQVKEQHQKDDPVQADETPQQPTDQTTQSNPNTNDHDPKIDSPCGEHKEEETSSSSNSGGGWENTIGELLLSLPSFDYSHFVDGHNDMVAQQETPKQRKIATPSRMLANRRMKQNAAFPTIVESPEEKKEMDTQDDPNPAYEMQQQFFHGVPLFLSSLSQVRVSKVSAHPLGAHVLMISEEALLFSYGLNNHGQLGIGFKSDVKNFARGFHTTPTLITPLLENGGKTIDCAAGLDHSLVVVATEGRRLQKLQTNPGVAYSDHGVHQLRVPDSPTEPHVGAEPSPCNDGNHVDERFHFSEASVQHHQVYGFGRNNFMKLGLIRPNVTGEPKQEHGEDEVLPRRVALHCTVWPDEGDQDPSVPPHGIFSIAASAEHSAALIRRATGDIEVSMWGNASLGALGLPLNMDSQKVRGEIARKPSFKERNISPLPTIVESLSHRKSDDPSSPFAKQISLGPYCSFVVMSDGKCKSCGFSAEGMLGQGFNQTHNMVPEEVFLPLDEESPSSSRIASVSAGAFHVVAISENGIAYSWGINSNDRLGLGTIDYSDLADEVSQEKKENLVVIEWVPQKINVAQKTSPSTVNQTDKQDGNAVKENAPTLAPENRIALACAGYDCSMLVTECGQVLSFGKRSGKLGKGEVSSNVNTPQPLYGGLHLFHARRKRSDSSSFASPQSGKRRPQGLQRRASASVLYDTC